MIVLSLALLKPVNALQIREGLLGLFISFVAKPVKGLHFYLNFQLYIKCSPLIKCVA